MMSWADCASGALDFSRYRISLGVSVSGDFVRPTRRAVCVSLEFVDSICRIWWAVSRVSMIKQSAYTIRWAFVNDGASTLPVLLLIMSAIVVSVTPRRPATQLRTVGDGNVRPVILFIVTLVQLFLKYASIRMPMEP